MDPVCDSSPCERRETITACCLFFLWIMTLNLLLVRGRRVRYDFVKQLKKDEVSDMEKGH